jgi:hypothetical protein
VKLKHLIATAVLALTGLPFLAPSAKAGTVTTNLSEVILGFRATGGMGADISLEIDLGPAAQFYNAGAGSVTTLTQLNVQDLISTYGPDWNTRSDLYWGIVGTTGASVGTPDNSRPSKTLWASSPETTPGTQSLVRNKGTTFAQQGPANTIATMLVNGAPGTLSGATSTANSGSAAKINAASPGSWAYQIQIADGTSFGYFNPVVENPLNTIPTSPSGVDGTGYTVLDFYELVPGSGAGTLLGGFGLNSSGKLVFAKSIALFAPVIGSVVKFETDTYSVDEAAGQVAIKILRGGDLTNSFTVQFDTSNATAMAGTDFTGQSNVSVPFAANQTEATIMVAISHVAGYQGDRSFFVTLSNASSGATLVLPKKSTVNIVEADSNPLAGQIAFGAATYEFPALDALAEPNDVAVTLTRTSGTATAVSVDVSVTGGTLTNGTEYETFTNPTTVAFTDGQMSNTVHLQLKAIGANKLPGTINLALSHPRGGVALGSQTSAIVTIAAPDTVVPKVVVSPKPKTLAASFDLMGTASDNKGIARVEIRVNGGPIQLAALGAFANGQASFKLAGIQAANGKNNLVVQAFDLEGNASKPVIIAASYVNPLFAGTQYMGTYNGLLVPAVTPLSNNLSGFVTLKVMPTGSFTGKVLLGGFSVPITGVFGNDKVAHFDPTLATSFELIGKATPPVSLGKLELTIAPDKITGFLKNGAPAVIATADLDRAFFDGKTPATTVADKFLVNKGLFTVAFPSKSPQTGLTKVQFPQGDGVATLTVGKSGSVSLKGTLADGTKIMAKAPLSKDYRVPLFEALYSGGSIAGFATLDDTQADSDVKGTDFLWFRPDVTGSDYYPAGWKTGVKTDLIGARFASAAPILPGLKAVDAANGNVSLIFADGKLTGTGMVTKAANIDPATSKVTNAPATDTSFKLSLKTAAGGLSGTFTHTDTTTTKFVGVLLQKGVNIGGFGYFLSTPAAGGPAESGGVSLTKK